MFGELTKYKSHGHFFFKHGDSLKTVSKDVPDLPGVYYILRLSRGKVDLVYIGKSGILIQSGEFKDQLLRGRINNKQEGVSRQQYLEQKIREEQIDSLDIYWFVTFDEKLQHLPAYVEGIIMQRYFDVYKELPLWNKEF